MIYNEKLLKGVAISAICVSALVFGEIAVAYFILRTSFATADAHHSELHWLLFACKVSTFLMCPGLCIVIIGMGLTILRYLRTKSEQVKADRRVTH